jgi:scyllo-inositol 2-dehydrogenase (NADP+)
MSVPISVGIIGFGRIGAEHAAWLSRCAGIRAAAVADATPARAELARKAGLKVYASLDQMLGARDIQAVLVATPTAMHFDHATLALKAGKHVMVEKPMALELPQAREMTELAEKMGLVLSVFHNRRWDVDYLTARKHVEAGTFGRLINVESRLGQWASCVGPAAVQYRPSWRNEAAFGGGGLYDWGSHFVDQIWRLLWPSRPIRVYAQLRGNVWTHDCDDFARVILDFDNGCVAMVEINTTTTRPGPRWHIDGAEGSASSPHSLEFDTAVWARLEMLPAPREGQTGAARRLEQAEAGMTEPEIWERFAAALRGEGEPAVPVRSVLPTMMLLDAARESGATGAAISVAGRVEWVY